MIKGKTVEIGVYYFPYNETSATFEKDTDLLKAGLCYRKDYIQSRAIIGRPMRLSELLKDLDIRMDKPEYAFIMVHDLIWFESPEGWFVGAVSKNGAQD